MLGGTAPGKDKLWVDLRLYVYIRANIYSYECVCGALEYWMCPKVCMCGARLACESDSACIARFET